MGEIIQFPTSTNSLTRQERIELEEIKKDIEKAETLRQIIKCKKRLKAFKNKLDSRTQS